VGWEEPPFVANMFGGSHHWRSDSEARLRCTGVILAPSNTAKARLTGLVGGHPAEG
jgi:hypothetical protein